MTKYTLSVTMRTETPDKKEKLEKAYFENSLHWDESTIMTVQYGIVGTSFNRYNVSNLTLFQLSQLILLIGQHFSQFLVGLEAQSDGTR